MLQERLQHQTGQREQDIRRYGPGRETTKEDAGQHEDAMYDDGDEMSTIQDSHIALRDLLGRFLSWLGPFGQFGPGDGWMDHRMNRPGPYSPPVRDR